MGQHPLGNRTAIVADTANTRRTTAFAYDSVGNMTATTDPRGGVTTATWDAGRQLLTTTSPGTPAAPSGLVTANTYDPNGQLLQVRRSANGATLTTASATTGVGAAGGAVLGRMIPYAFKTYVSNAVKGSIGEGLTQLDLTLSRQIIVDRNVLNGFGKSTFDFMIKGGSFVESKFGTSTLSKPQRRAAAQFGDDLRVDYWNYPTVSGLGAAGVGAGVAGPSSSPGK